MPFQCLQFSQPCNLSPSLCLLRYLIQFRETAPVTKHLRLLRVQTVEGALRVCPFQLPFFLPKVLFPSEGNLQREKQKLVLSNDIMTWQAGMQASFITQIHTYPLLNHKIPCLATQGIAGEELDEIKWNVEDKVEQPNHTGPAPSDPFNCRKVPVCIYGYQCSNLIQQHEHRKKKKEESDLS